MSVFGELNRNQRGLSSKDNSILPSIYKSTSAEKSSFLSNSILNSKIYSNIENSMESKLFYKNNTYNIQFETKIEQASE